jgi:exopolysaccharide/PEP-CTERM locus tyrosine autokinase
MKLAEQAVQRLEQLERAGVVVPWSAAKAAPSQRRAEPPHTQACIDLQRLRDAGCLVPDPLHSQLKEQFRQLKRPLLETARAPGAGGRRRGGQIMVTSALRGEGKTFCALNLAMSMAMEIDTAVILVDADVVRPSVFARLGIAARPPGLLDLLAGTVNELPQALVGTDVPKLLLMSAGEPNLRASELLASAAMDRLLTRLDEAYADHVVIFDAPPLLVTTESTVLAAKVGQVVVVVETGKTPRAAVQQAFAAVKGCPVVVSVLNKSHDG